MPDDPPDHDQPEPPLIVLHPICRHCRCPLCRDAENGPRCPHCHPRPAA